MSQRILGDDRSPARLTSASILDSSTRSRRPATPSEPEARRRPLCIGRGAGRGCRPPHGCERVVKRGKERRSLLPERADEHANSTRWASSSCSPCRRRWRPRGLPHPGGRPGLRRVPTRGLARICSSMTSQNSAVASPALSPAVDRRRRRQFRRFAPDRAQGETRMRCRPGLRPKSPAGADARVRIDVGDGRPWLARFDVKCQQRRDLPHQPSGSSPWKKQSADGS